MTIYEPLTDIISDGHTLIAGATGSGKSVLIDDFIYSILPVYPNCEYILIDPKRVGLNKYRKLKRLRCKANTPEQAVEALDIAIAIMDKRYRRMERKGEETSTDEYIFIIIDEIADLVGDKQFKERLIKILRLGRAANIRILLASQSPNRKTLCADIIQNVKTRIGLRCSDAIESRQIIGCNGCEALPDYGEMYIRDCRGNITYHSVPFVNRGELAERITKFSKRNFQKNKLQ